VAFEDKTLVCVDCGAEFTFSAEDAVCSGCGAPCQVPFEPRLDKPVYCDECFAKQRANRPRW
jgi:CxxC-x17-CxxC domain-containing protein